MKIYCTEDLFIYGEKNRFEEFVNIANGKNIEVNLLSKHPWSSKLFSDFSNNSKYREDVFFVNLTWAKHMLRNNLCGLYFNLNDFKISNYMKHIPYIYLLNSDGIIKKYKHININKLDYPCFVKSNFGTKFFTGGVFNKEELIKEFNYLNPYEDAEFFIAKPKEINKEYRIWFFNNEIVGSSYYDINFNYDVFPNDILDFARKVNNCIPYKDHVLDVCVTKDKFLKVVEINAFSTSGFYNIDFEYFLDKIGADKNE